MMAQRRPKAAAAGEGDQGFVSAQRQGRSENYIPPTFHPNERNTYLFRSLFVFVYIGIGIDVVTGFIGINIVDHLLDKRSHVITDESVIKIIWLVCNFEHILETSHIKDQFINNLTQQWQTDRATFMKQRFRVEGRYRPENISKSIATLTARVFASFQEANQRGRTHPEARGSAAADAAAADAAAAVGEINHIQFEVDHTIVVTTIESQRQTISINNNDWRSKLTSYEPDRPAQDAQDAQPAQDAQLVQPASAAPPAVLERRITPRLEALRQKTLEAKIIAQQQQQAQAAAQAEAVRQEAVHAKLQLEEFTRNLRTNTLKIFPHIDLTITDNEFEIRDCSIQQFYKYLPILMTRMQKCIVSPLTNKDVSKEPGSAGALIELGLIEPKKLKGQSKLPQIPNEGLFGGGMKEKTSRPVLYGGVHVARDFFEHKGPIPQCDGTIGNYHNYVIPSCYICGQVWVERTQESMECEHILCVIHGIEYFGLLQSVYFSPEQKNFLSMLYAWAHHCCNQRKGNIAFIRKNNNADADQRRNNFVPDDINIRKLLEDIFTSSRESNPKLDCPIVLKKVQDKKKFVDERTKVVTSYVMPLVTCINSVYTDIFKNNTILFNALGCLKKIAELCIHFTSQDKNLGSPLRIEFKKTHDCMDILFPDYVAPEGGVGAGAGAGVRRGRPGIPGIPGRGGAGRSKNKKKSLRHRIQYGGMEAAYFQNITDAFGSIVEQTINNNQLNVFNTTIDEDAHINGQSSSYHELNDTANTIVNTILSPPLIDNNEESAQINSLLFVLFILNHYRNPDVLFSIFATPVPDDVIQQQNQYTELRRQNHDAFSHVCEHVFPTIDTIIQFLEQSEMIPSLKGVLMICQINSNSLNAAAAAAAAALAASAEAVADPPQVTAFQSVFENFGISCIELMNDRQHFNNAVVITKKSSPLDYLVNACFHLKRCLSASSAAAAPAAARAEAARAEAAAQAAETAGQKMAVNPAELAKRMAADAAVNMLKNACNLFPQCYDAADLFSLFSYFGPCFVYSPGTLLSNPEFQLAMGYFARAKNLFAATNDTDYEVHDAGKASLIIFKSFFKSESTIISSKRDRDGSVTPTPRLLSPVRNPFNELSSGSSQSSESPESQSQSQPQRMRVELVQEKLPREIGGSIDYGGGSSTRRRRRYHHNRQNQYTNKDKRSSRSTKYNTIKHHKSYRKHNRTIKRRSHRK